MARIIVAGYIVRYPLGGQVWAHLQYVLGLARLGHMVYFFEDAGWPDACYDPAHDRMGNDAAYGLRALDGLMRRFDLGERWVFRDANGHEHGPCAGHSERVIREADLLVNLSGVTWFADFERIARRVFIDEDPLFTQVRAATDRSYFDRLAGHGHLCSYGAVIGRPGCTVPTLGLTWHAACQPVVLDEWPAQADEPAGPFTTVMTWNAYGAVEWGGLRYGQKSDGFPAVHELARRTTQTFELALGGDDVPEAELRRDGWRLRDPLEVSADADRYREYIQRSRGEFSVAKHAYVATHSGWFSDRSAAYLASGRPVVLQDTGYGDWLPTGEGLLAFRNLDEAQAAIEQVNADYARHARAARAIADEHFDARRVLETLLAGL